MNIIKFPPQALPYNKKNKEWRKQCVDWAETKTFFNYSLCRKSTIHKRINYDLLNGKLHMSDLIAIINPDKIQAGYIPDTIQHYPIMNSKLNVLIGEESSRTFDYRVTITNSNALSEIENNKKTALYQRLQEWVMQKSQSDEEAQRGLEEIGDYFTYEWQDSREIRANQLLKHYSTEYNFTSLFNTGFKDTVAVGEEMYQCDIVGGEPVIVKLNPEKVRILKSGYSNKVEDADIIIIEDYWSPGKVIDTYYDVLSKKDIEYIESIPNNYSAADSMDNIDERFGFIPKSMIDDTFQDSEYIMESPFSDISDSSLMPFDMLGNVRVIRIYWKSKRKIKKVRSYNPMTGEEMFNFYPETYKIHKELGEEEEVLYINEAWEGTKIGSDIYVNMRPRVIQYNRLDNPSRCHFGIIGSIYNLGDNKPFSLVDMMKPYSYYYDVIYDRLNKLIARSWGSLLRLDLSKKPASWDIDKWMYYAKTMGIMVENSFNEGTSGPAKGKLAGGLNNASSGVIAASDGNMIQQYVTLLDYIKNEMAEVAGISRQREGQISNRETVGGVERATLQSSHITEWLFTQHTDVKKRVLECFIETAKIALKGRKKKFQYILSDNSMKVMEIDGDEFSECDYGICVDTTSNAEELNSKLDTLAQAALQNQALSFSAIMKLYGSSSLAEKQRLIEKDERAMLERQSQAQEQQSQLQQQQLEQQAQLEQAKMEQEDVLNKRDNDTKIYIAQLQATNNNVSIDDNSEDLEEKKREFNLRLQLDRERLAHDKNKARIDTELRRRQINNQSKRSKE